MLTRTRRCAIRKLYIFGLIVLAATIISLAWAEQITLTTYYPAPYGVYKTMKANVMHLNPIPSSTYSFDSTEDAMLICDSDDNTVKRWDSTANGGLGDWVSLGGMDTALLSQNGYTKLPSGLIIQWGTQANYTQLANDHLFVENFPIAFPNAVLNVTAGMMHQAGTDLDASVSARVINNSQVELQLDEWSGTTNWIKCTYIAIGY
ncbi:MAG: hypothetical protein ISS43_03880 [Candidatus Omnitrophica bacterium]|nr:hypothetical protein [Candidatus Omnitrophota bacterium]